MNLKMSFYGQQKQQKCEPLVDIIVDRIRVEPQERSVLDLVLIYGHYAIDYMILWAIIALSIREGAPPTNFAMPFALVRAFIAVLFILIQHPLFFFLAKGAALTRMLLVENHEFLFEVPCLTLELLMCLVWTLTKEQRQVHLDSRIGFKLSFLKQTLIYGIVFIENAVEALHGTDDKVCFLVAILIGITWADFMDTYYYSQFKSNLISFDLTLLFFSSLVLLKGFLHVSFASYVQISLMALVIFFIQFSRKKILYETALKTPLRDIQGQLDKKSVEFWIDLKLLADSHNQKQLEMFIEKMRRESQDPEIQSDIKTISCRSLQIKKTFIHNFIIKSLKKCSQISSVMLDLLIYLYSPDPEVYSCLNLGKWQHKRQYKRILKQNQGRECILQKKQMSLQKEKHRKVLVECIDLRIKFLIELMRQKVSQQRILDLGSQLTDKINGFKEEHLSNPKICPESLMEFYKFGQECLGPYYSDLIGEQSLEGFLSEQSEAHLLVGLHQDNLGKIFQVNKQFQKINHNNPRKLVFQQIFGSEQAAFLKQLMHTYVEDKSQKEILEKKIPMGWVYSREGFMTLCEIVLTKSHYGFEECLKIILNPVLSERALLLTSQEGRVIGVSQLAFYFGFQASHTFKFVYMDIMKELLSSRSIELRQGAYFLKESKFTTRSRLQMTAIATQDCLPLKGTAIVVEVGAPSPQKNSQAEPERGTSSFEFHFGWDGKIRNKFKPIEITLLEEQQRQVVNYGEGITEMRYFDEKVDYKVNFEEERECQALPRLEEEDFDEILEGGFYEKVLRKKQQTPTSLKAGYIVLALLTVVSLVVGLYLVLTYRQYSSRSISHFEYTCKLTQKFSIYNLIAILPFGPSLNLTGNHNQMIQGYQLQISKLENELFRLLPDLALTSEGKIFQSTENEFKLLFNNYLTDQNNLTAQAILAYVDTLTPAAYSFSAKVMAVWKAEFSSFRAASETIFIVFCVAAVLIVAALLAIEWRLVRHREEIADILKAIDNQALAEQKKRAEQFGMWVEGGQKKEEVAVEDSDKQNFSPTKAVRREFRLRGISVLYILWLGVTLVLFMVYLKRVVLEMSSASSNYLELVNYNQKSITANNMILGAMLRDPAQSSLTLKLFGQNINLQFIRNGYYQTLARQPGVNLQSFYSGFWDSPQFCNYLNVSGCSTVLGEATADGANMVINYLLLKYDSFFSSSLRGQSVLSQSDLPMVAHLNVFYLLKMVQVSNQYIFLDFQGFVDSVTVKVIALMVGGLIVTFGLFFFMWQLRREFRREELHEDILLTIPFDKLKQVTAFHYFYLKYYAHL